MRVWGGEAFPLHPPVDETLIIAVHKLELSISYHNFFFYIGLTAIIQLTATINFIEKDIPDTRILATNRGTQVTITCSGSGNYIWSSSGRLNISIATALSINDDIYQRRDVSINGVVLVINRFGIDYQGEYICSNYEDATSESIFIAQCKFCNYKHEVIVFITHFPPILYSSIHFYFAINNQHNKRWRGQYSSIHLRSCSIYNYLVL